MAKHNVYSESKRQFADRIDGRIRRDTRRAAIAAKRMFAAWEGA